MNAKSRAPRKLEVEALEDRFMPAISFNAMATVANVQAPAGQTAQQRDIGHVTLNGGDVSRHTSWLAGLGRNHNETLVRDRN